MKRLLDVLLGVALVGVWAIVAVTASDATVRDEAAPVGEVRATAPANNG